LKKSKIIRSKEKPGIPNDFDIFINFKNIGEEIEITLRFRKQ
jgi:hypothetical protein